MIDLGGQWRTWIYLTEHLLLSSLFWGGLENKLYLPSLSFFKDKRRRLYIFFYTWYLDYEHEVLYTLSKLL